MAIKPDQERKPAGAGAEDFSTRTSELDLTKRSTGPIWRQYLRAMGPGLVTGASDDDPSGIATYAQAGAKYGLSFLWAALLTLPLRSVTARRWQRALASASSPSSVSAVGVERS